MLNLEGGGLIAPFFSSVESNHRRNHMYSVKQAAVKLVQFISKNNLEIDRGILKHDLIHSCCQIGLSLQEEILIFCLERGRLISRKQADSIANQIAKLNRIPNDFCYDTLANFYSQHDLSWLTDELVEEVAKLLHL